MSGDCLRLFTAEFPFGHKETFIENELPILAQRFSRVVIYPQVASGRPRSVPTNVDVVVLDRTDPPFSSGRELRSNPVRWGRVMASEALRSGAARRDLRGLGVKLLGCFHRAQILASELRTTSPGDGLCYTYWLDIWATVLAALTEQGAIPGFVSRAHGFDLYDERRPQGFTPFRPYQLKHCSRVYACSRDGAEYLRRHYPRHADHVTHAYLGVPDRGEGRFDESAPFTILSCSNMVPMKRVHLIAESLASVSIPVRWIHFGDGPTSEVVEGAVARLPGHVEADLRGRVPNDVVLASMRDESVNLFVNVSDSEGLPVSIMEAASFGIPTLATDVGGTREIVGAETGVLLARDFAPEEAAREIEAFARSDQNSRAFRQGVRAFWRDHFEAEANYSAFADDLESVARSWRQ